MLLHLVVYQTDVGEQGKNEEAKGDWHCIPRACRALRVVLEDVVNVIIAL